MITVAPSGSDLQIVCIVLCCLGGLRYYDDADLIVSSMSRMRMSLNEAPLCHKVGHEPF